MVLLISLPHYVFQWVRFLFFHLFRGRIQLGYIGYSQFLQILGLPFFSLLPFSLDNIGIEGFPVLSN